MSTSDLSDERSSDNRPDDRTTSRASLRSVYLYLVCLVTLVMAIVGAVGIARGAVDLAYPDPGYYGFDAAYGPDGKSTLTEEQQAARRRDAEASQRRQAVVGLVGSAALLLVAGPVYGYHWRRVQDEHVAGVSPSAAERPD